LALAVAALNCLAFPLLAASNKPPVAANDSFSANANTTLTVPAPGVLANDTDQNGDPLTAVLVGNVSHGTLQFNANGSFTYTPATNFSGTDSFVYKANDGKADSGLATVTITVNAAPGNHPPVVSDFSGIFLANGTEQQFTFCASDADGDPLTFRTIQPPSHGTAHIVGGTVCQVQVIYTPGANFVGTDTFTYVANDGKSDSNTGNATLIVQPNVIIDDVSVNEGNSSGSVANFVVNLSAPAGTEPITIDWRTEDGTAVAPSDYIAASGTLTFSAGVQQETISISIVPDLLSESDETFVLHLLSASNIVFFPAAGEFGTCTILNDDAPKVVSINHVSVQEGNSSLQPHAALFTVSLSPPSTQTVTVNWATHDGTAVAPGDYASGSGTLTFSPGTTNQFVRIVITPDTHFEFDETFSVQLSSPVNAILAGTGIGTGTILNDDTRIGVTEGIPPEAIVKVGERFTYGIKWTHPVRWRLLDTVDIRIIDDQDSILNVRFTEADNTFSLFNPANGKFLHPDAPGSRTHFETSAAVMYLEHSEVIGSGPTGPSVLLNLNLSFKPKAAGRDFRVEAFATDDDGNEQGFDEAGIIAVLR